MNTSNINQVQEQFTYYLIKCSKSLVSYGPAWARLSFKYDNCPNCSNRAVIVLLNLSSSTQTKLLCHITSDSIYQLQVKLDYYLSLILDEYMFTIGITKHLDMSKSHSIVSTGDFLSQIDSSLSKYTTLLVNKGFSNTQTLAHLSFSDIPEIPLGLRQLLLHEVGKLRSPLNRQLMNHKDSNSDRLLGRVIDFQSDSPIIISDDSNSRSMVLRPKQLFPSRNTGDNFVVDKTSVALSAYQYQSPMEKHLSTVLTEISQKELEIEKIKAEIESMKPTDYTNGDVAITCGWCHQGNHTKRRCVDPPCTTSISCGKIRFHKSEMKVVENKKVQLKKLIHDKVSLESESKKIRETIASTVKTFPQAVKTALINSNKKEYLTIHEGKFVPLTTRINRDISILQKYYNGRIPSDIQTREFFISYYNC